MQLGAFVGYYTDLVWKFTTDYVKCVIIYNKITKIYKGGLVIINTYNGLEIRENKLNNVQT